MHYHRVLFRFDDTNHTNGAELDIVDAHVREHCSSLEFVCWDLKAAKELLLKEYPCFADVFNLSAAQLSKPIVLCDLFRYVLMYHFGGVYTDMDFIPIRPFESFLHHLDAGSLVYEPRAAAKPSVVLSEEWLESNTQTDTIHNGILFSRYPRHPFWLKLMHEVYATIKANHGDIKSDTDVYLASGPNRLSKFYKENVAHFQDVCLLPHFYFCPYVSYEVPHDDDNRVITDVYNSHRLQKGCMPDRKFRWVFFNINQHTQLSELCPNSFFVNIFMNTGSMWKK